MRLVGSVVSLLFLVLVLVLATTVRGQVPGPIGLPWVRVPAGVFQIGCVPADPDCLDNERPRHEVTLSLPFDLMATEVTVGQYLRFARSTDHRLPPQPNFVQRGDHPIVLVDWDDAVAFCGWAGGVSPPRPSGSMPPDLATMGGSSGGVMRCPATGPISVRQSAARVRSVAPTSGSIRPRSARCRQTTSACTTCRATSGNGWPTGTAYTAAVRQSTPVEPRRGSVEWPGVGHG